MRQLPIVTRTSMPNRVRIPVGLLFSTILLAACATPKPSEDAFNSAERGIDAAIQAGAEQHAPVELRFAREKLAEARKGMEQKSFEKAFYLVDQSEINAELAVEKSREARVRADLAEQEKLNEVLTEDFVRTYGAKP
ncbi:MAG: DUF4398 domain-containing protein [Xanthomonadales bacterium]|nr:DUF4398 domain-containing protein [Xanthomonadales bacterium]